MTKDKLRQNFSIKIINEVYEEQGRVCSQCGKSLLGGFEAHHIDGDNTNNSKENCQLICERCHDSKAYETKQKQLGAVVGELRLLIQKALDGQMAGALMDKALDGIKLQLSLEKQIRDDRLMEAPAISRIEYSQEIMEWNLREYSRGFRDGLLKGADIMINEWQMGIAEKIVEQIIEKTKEKGESSNKKKVE